jgi:D-amino-acid dehydrogenase
MTPDGTPIVGGTRYPNLYISTGHGTLGWTMAAGTAGSWPTSDGSEAQIETDDLGIARYARSSPTLEARLQWSV